jgi:hypothetical protein
MKAENALKDRQSRFVCGFEKLKANMMKINELIMTNDHKPYADSCVILAFLRYGRDDHSRHDLHGRHEIGATADIAAAKHKAGTAPHEPGARSRENKRQALESRLKPACFEIARSRLHADFSLCPTFSSPLSAP